MAVRLSCISLGHFLGCLHCYCGAAICPWALFRFCKNLGNSNWEHNAVTFFFFFQKFYIFGPNLDKNVTFVPTLYWVKVLYLTNKIQWNIYFQDL